ncbi:hypothetical protein SAMN04488136_10844 [Vibrio xiamenensis]|uniref:Uncharacterized protein n=1 Tax=Vibrio xiamenensis TaxID=861298 RepID=A0A1G7ZLP7_9VIBR|nr:hypothetical protein [Vibrio xiamenensis]SDH09662.1 hypothetical protein SAMN04488136_10844 [Vibrio xiamenensis]
MNRTLMVVLLGSLSSSTFAADNHCLAGKYDAYVDASLQWYQDLTDLTTTQYPQLKDVSEWFLSGRQHHFELSREAVRYYLEHDPSKVATEQSVEGWLKLEQVDIKRLANRDDQLGQLAKITYQDRQSTPHADNYELRSAFADLLSHPATIDKALQTYNQSINQLEKIECQ